MKGTTVREREKCPKCGYKLASVNAEKGTVHCPSCHRTSAWTTTATNPAKLAALSAATLDDTADTTVEWISPSVFVLRTLQDDRRYEVAVKEIT